MEAQQETWAAAAPSGPGERQVLSSVLPAAIPAEPFILTDPEPIPAEELTERVCAIYDRWDRGELDVQARNREFDYLRQRRPICSAAGCIKSAQVEDVCGDHLARRR